MRITRWLAIVLIGLGFGSFDATAAGSRWWDQLPKMDKTDIRMAKQAARVQLQGKAPGTIARWRNPKTGNSGAVKLLKSFQWQGRACRHVVHKFEMKNQEDQIWEVQLCQVKSGDWKWPIPPKRLF
jgi:surface antigen